MSSISNMRIDYPDGQFDHSNVNPDPFKQFANWLQAAMDAGHIEPNAMTLATATLDGRPSARIVLLKGLDDQGFVFFTNYHSRKGQEIALNPHVALVFYWDRQSRQVRIEGTIQKTSEAESDAYFATRPRDSQIGAWASQQSKMVENRTVLEAEMSAAEERFKGNPIPRPDNWGGYRVTPHTIEFWQGRPSRLHDRLRYTKQPDGTWQIDRLSP